MQSTRRLVVLAFEFAASVQDGQNHFQCRLLRFGMFVDGNAATIVRDRDRLSVLVQRHLNLAGVTIHGLVDRVIKDLPNKVV